MTKGKENKLRHCRVTPESFVRGPLTVVCSFFLPTSILFSCTS